MERPSPLITLFLLVSSCFPALSHDVSVVFVFGDSIFDTGNNRFNRNCTAQADFPPYGSSFFHHPTGGSPMEEPSPTSSKPYLEARSTVINGIERNFPSIGINFASAGSGVIRGTNKDMSGSNDVFDYFLPFDAPTLGPDAYAQAMLARVAHFIGKIYKLGARRIAVFLLGPVGCVPARALLPGAPVGRCYGKMNSMVKKYNRGLESLARDVPLKYPGALVFTARCTILFNGFVQSPRAMVHNVALLSQSIYYMLRIKFVAKVVTLMLQSLSDVSSTCCGGGTLGGMLQCGKEGHKICSDPKRFLFRDYFHPSEHPYHLISNPLWGGKRSWIRPMNLNTLANVSVSRSTSLKNITG
ncbi:hypothetical protein NL676_037902 [Syzygium grande]|nr:hypothetical protein NL676_037902 [Syzygium grande]